MRSQRTFRSRMPGKKILQISLFVTIKNYGFFSSCLHHRLWAPKICFWRGQSFHYRRIPKRKSHHIVGGREVGNWIQLEAFQTTFWRPISNAQQKAMITINFPMIVINFPRMGLSLHMMTTNFPIVGNDGN